jgi:hypothetical protein
MDTSMMIPTGYTFVPGRSREKSLELVKLNRELGHEDREVGVRTLPPGYIVLDDVAAKFDESLQQSALEQAAAESVPAATDQQQTAGEGEIVQPHEDATEVVGDAQLPVEEQPITEPVGEAEATRLEMPETDANKPLWLAYAEQEAGHEIDPKTTKAELIAQYGPKH